LFVLKAAAEERKKRENSYSIKSGGFLLPESLVLVNFSVLESGK
jgi:hypothetical protein